jgi:AraC family transcriptional regulator of arabinose operon
MREHNPSSASHLRALIELLDREWHRFAFTSFGFWRDRGWNGASSGFELNFYTRGENTVIQDKRTMTFKQGDLVFMPDKARHSFCDDGSFELYYLMFQFDRPDLNAQMRKWFDQLDIRTAPLAMPGLQNDFRALMTELGMNRQNSMMAKHYFIHIFVRVYMEQMHSAGHRNRKEQMVRRVIEDIQEQMQAGGKILLPELAARHSLNERYLNRMFKSVTGTTLGKYMLTMRIEGAKRLLETTSMSITEIAIDTGFYDGAHFSKANKSSESMPPQEYREQHASMQIRPD